MISPEDEFEDKVAELCWKIIWALVFISLVVFLAKTACGQDFDGICRMTCNGKQWTGVAISDHEILSVAHPKETTKIRAEFPERGHGAFERLGIETTVIRSDAAADLALLSYKRPSYAAIRVYKVSGGEFTDCLIRGYVGDNPKIMKTNLLAQDEVVDGHNVLTLNGRGIPGMSGSPVTADDVVVGIMFGITDTKTNAVSAETIIQFLEAK